MTAATETLVESRPFRAIAHDFTVAAPPDIVAHVEQIFAALPEPETARHRYEIGRRPDHYYLRSADGTTPDRSRAPARLITVLMWHVNQGAVASAAGRVVLHAAAAARDGDAVVLTGAEEAGKTTLVTGLVQAGMQYLTDEAVVVDPTTGVAHPYPKPLSMDHGAWPLFPSLAPVDGLEGWEWAPCQIAPGRLAGGVGTATPIKHILLVRYTEGVETRLVPLRRAEMVAALAAQTFGFGRFGVAGLRALAEVVRSVSCHRLEVGSLQRACGLVADLMDRDRSPMLAGRT